MSTLIKLLVALFALSFFTACEQEPITQPQKTIETSPDPDGSFSDFIDHPANGHEQGIEGHVSDQGFFDINDVEEIDFEFPDGSVEKRYRLDGDIVLTKEELCEKKHRIH